MTTSEVVPPANLAAANLAADELITSAIGANIWSVLADDGLMYDGLDDRTVAYLRPFVEANPHTKGVLAQAARLRQSNARLQPRTKPRYVYFAQAEGSRLIKIGCASDPPRRVGSLQIGSGEHLRLLGAIDGGQPLEGQLHRRFAHLRVRGEWFRPSQELATFIEEALA